jgi:hypothetical protein
MQPQQLLQPQGMLQPVYTTQQQQQLNPQQQQWNSGIQTMMSNQPQPGLLYAQQRMNNS